MWLVELFNGFGTELGVFNLVVYIILGFILKHVWNRSIKPVWDKDVGQIVKEHEEMWGEFERKKRNEESQSRKLTEKERLGLLLGELLDEREEK